MDQQNADALSNSERRKGPVVLRRGRNTETSTSDQRLLDRRGTGNWIHSDPWRVMRIQSEFVEGFGALAEVPKAVTVFGSARTPRDHVEYERARNLGAALAEAGFAVITGGASGMGRIGEKPPPGVRIFVAWPW